MVGERGFEPPTPWSRTRCSTRLSHSPTCWFRASVPPFYSAAEEAANRTVADGRCPRSGHQSIPVCGETFAMPQAVLHQPDMPPGASDACDRSIAFRRAVRSRRRSRAPRGARQFRPDSSFAGWCHRDRAQRGTNRSPVAIVLAGCQAALSRFLPSGRPGASSMVTRDNASAARANSSAWCQALRRNERCAASHALL